MKRFVCLFLTAMLLLACIHLAACDAEDCTLCPVIRLTVAGLFLLTVLMNRRLPCLSGILRCPFGPLPALTVSTPVQLKCCLRC